MAPICTINMENNELRILTNAIQGQRKYVDKWRQPVEPLLFETIRALDALFMQDLFLTADSPDRLPNPVYALCSWGVNQALARMIPDVLSDGPFRLFPSTLATQGQANQFIFHCGVLERAQILREWLEDGLLAARLDTPDRSLESGIKQILVLKKLDPSLFSETIAYGHREWMCNRVMEFDRPWERRLKERYADILPELERRVGRFAGWGISYTTTKEIDDYFLECGQVYLRRMWSQDLLGAEEKLGDNQFNDYLGVLAALAGRAEKHHCFCLILKHRHPELKLQNLLTTFSPYEEFVKSLAHYLDADTLQIQKLMNCLTLGPENRDAHTKSTDTAWAPVIRSSISTCVLPLFGLEINPFLFLLKDLQKKYPRDWDKAANNREKRWIVDLRHIFSGKRWRVRERNLNLRDSGRTITDIDFVAYDSESNELAIFQLKWQQPVGYDSRVRRSVGKNLVSEGNRWIAAVDGWLSRFGIEELARRADIAVMRGATVHFFVVARYGALFSGFGGQDERAVWLDWNHLVRIRMENPKASVSELARLSQEQIEQMKRSLMDESYILPLGELAVILNPTSEPSERQ